MEWQTESERYAESQIQYVNNLVRMSKDERALVRQLIARAYIEGATTAMLRAQGIVAEA